LQFLQQAAAKTISP